MAVTVDIGVGSTFEVYYGGSYVQIAEVISITPPNANLDIIDATNMDSTGGIREFIVGLEDPGEAGFEMHFIPNNTSDTTIRAVRAAKAAVSCRITFPNAVTWTFDGIVNSYEPSLPIDDKMTAVVGIKVTGTTTVA